jgi:hypothetical protein
MPTTKEHLYLEVEDPETVDKIAKLAGVKVTYHYIWEGPRTDEEEAAWKHAWAEKCRYRR